MCMEIEKGAIKMLSAKYFVHDCSLGSNDDNKSPETFVWRVPLYGGPSLPREKLYKKCREKKFIQIKY